MDAWVVAKFAQIEAIKAEIEGMKIANLIRERNGEAPAYGEDAFIGMAKDLQSIANSLN